MVGLNKANCLPGEKPPIFLGFWPNRALKPSPLHVSLRTRFSGLLLTLTVSSFLGGALSLGHAQQARAGDDMEEMLSLFDRYYEELDPSDPKSRPKNSSGNSGGASAEKDLNALFERKAAAHDQRRDAFWQELTQLEFSPLGEITRRDANAPTPQDDLEPDPELDAFLADLDAPSAPSADTTGSYQGPYRAGYEPEPSKPQEEVVIQGGGSPRLIEFKGKSKPKAVPKVK